MDTHMTSWTMVALDRQQKCSYSTRQWWIPRCKHLKYGYTLMSKLLRSYSQLRSFTIVLITTGRHLMQSPSRTSFIRLFSLNQLKGWETCHSPGVFTASFTLTATYGSKVTLSSKSLPRSHCSSFTRMKPTPGMMTVGNRVLSTKHASVSHGASANSTHWTPEWNGIAIPASKLALGNYSGKSGYRAKVLASIPLIIPTGTP